jgi:hypothetical protein
MNLINHMSFPAPNGERGLYHRLPPSIKRLQITADVDAAGLAKLKNVLAKYDEILKLLK